MTVNQNQGVVEFIQPFKRPRTSFQAAKRKTNLNNVVFKKRFQDFIFFKKGRCVKICYKSVLYSLFFVHRL